MMTNLFSIFDPAVPHLPSINWISLLAPMLLPLLCFKPNLSPISWLTNKLTSISFSELSSPLSKMTNFMLIVLSLFFFILMNNLTSNLPYIFPATSHISTTAILSLTTWIIIFLFSITKTLNKTITHLVPMKTPYLLVPFMVIIETISMLMRPLTLALRLAINIMTGHLLISLISEAFVSLPPTFTPLVSSALNPMMGLELAVACIQAYVFVMLITLYIKEAN